VLGSEAALANTAAVAGLASALTSLVKRMVQFIRAAANMQHQPTADAAAAYFPAAAPTILDQLFVQPYQDYTSQTVAASSSSSCSCSCSRQVHASAALLAVVLARSLVQLADAMEAAGPQLMFDSLVAAPAFKVQWASTFGQMLATALGLASDDQRGLSVLDCWRLCGSSL
jgi:hypothetical protein